MTTCSRHGDTTSDRCAVCDGAADTDALRKAAGLLRGVARSGVASESLSESYRDAALLLETVAGKDRQS